MFESLTADLLNSLFEIEAIALRIALTIPAIVLAFFAIKTSRTPQGAVGWIVFMFAYPFLGARCGRQPRPGHASSCGAGR